MSKHQELLQELALDRGEKIVFLIMDGLGGLPDPGKGTELAAAHSPHLDRLATEGTCGLLEPVGPGITPGSGPAHLALFGYDPVNVRIGRGVLSALGVDFALTDKDLAARLNFATIDGEGNVTDRRAGRLSNEENRKRIEMLRDGIKPPTGMEVFFETESEHRALLVVRGDGLDGRIGDTDPQITGVAPRDVKALDPRAEPTAEILRNLLKQVREILGGLDKGNVVLARGFAKFEPPPSLADLHKLRCQAIAQYPMYRGIARLVGMEVRPRYEDFGGAFNELQNGYEDGDFFFIHVKKTDSYGEDGNFEAKKKIIEEVDQHIPRLKEIHKGVIVVTGDHCTPSQMCGHSWHPVPVLIHAEHARVDQVVSFDDLSCGAGSLGCIPMQHLMSHALAHAGRLARFGA